MNTSINSMELSSSSTTTTITTTTTTTATTTTTTTATISPSFKMENYNYNKFNGLQQESNIHNSGYKEIYRRSIEQPEEFWGEVGKQMLHWDKPFEKVLNNINSPFTKWYEGGFVNASYNAVDRHVNAGYGNKVAIIHDSPMTNTIRKVTYQELYDSVACLAGGLNKLGVKKGDRVVIYMPLIPEAVMSMLATVRIGAIHSVVFGGFAASELRTRIEHAEPKVIIAANCGLEPNKIIMYIDILHDALARSKYQPVCSVIYQRHNILSSKIDPKSDILWETILKVNDPMPPLPVESSHPLYILYTSGTTDKPKGVQRPTGGHLVNLMYTMTTIYDLNSDDVWWAASDLGWVVGHSYICYGPLLFGATMIMYEGKPDRTPDPGQYFRIIEQHKVSAIFSVPTAFRVIRRTDPDLKYGSKYSTKTLRKIFIAGEHCDWETKNWIEKTFNVPVLNHWWQTETGSAITATCLGFQQSLQVPKFTTGLPYVGYDVKVLRPDGSQTHSNELGRIVVKLPLPPGNMSTLYKNDELFEKTYFQKYPGYYDTMDAGYKDEDGYIFVTARDDDVINVAGHRISTASLEDAAMRHPDVVDAAVFGVPESTKGEVPCCLYVTSDNIIKSTQKLNVEIIKIVRDIIGPIAAFKLVAQVAALPRTRSGKTMRKSMADFARNKAVILPGTIDDPSVFKDIRRALNELGYALTAPEPQFIKCT